MYMSKIRCYVKDFVIVLVARASILEEFWRMTQKPENYLDVQKKTGHEMGLSHLWKWKISLKILTSMVMTVLKSQFPVIVCNNIH